MSIKNIIDNVKSSILNDEKVLFTDVMVSEFIDDFSVLKYLIDFSSSESDLVFIRSPRFKQERNALVSDLEETDLIALEGKIKTNEYCTDLLVLRYLELKNKSLSENINSILTSIKKSITQW